MSLFDLSLRHYAESPVVLDRDREYKRDGRWNGKPDGLWVTIPGDDDWPTWCRREDFAVESLAVEHEVRLRLDANVLHLTTAAMVLQFAEQFGSDQHTRFPGIKWASVRALWQGIVIAPYQWSLRLERQTFWYYGWDVASGCIWDLDAIESFAVVAPVEAGVL